MHFLQRYSNPDVPKLRGVIQVLLRVFRACTGASLGRVLASRKDWGLDKTFVWKNACKDRGWIPGGKDTVV